MQITDELILREDVLIIPVTDLDEGVRKKIDCEASDFAVSRPASRAPSVVIDPQAAELVKRFRTPSTIVNAVIVFGRSQGLDPQEILESAYPLVRKLLDSRFLTRVGPEGPEAEASDGFARGERVAEAEVVRVVQSLDDSEIYQVKLPDGRPAALKILRRKQVEEGAWQAARQSLEGEAKALRHLAGSTAPALLEAGEAGGRPYLLLEWIAGVDVHSGAAEWRADRRGIVELCAAVASAYAAIHRAGVLHGDVHPRNVLVDRRGAARILDFGLARFVTDSPADQAPMRGGIPFFFEPEYARALLGGSPPPEVTPLGEQYSLAALLYYAVTGVHTRDFSLERERMLQQLAEDGPCPFDERGLAPWPELEQVLGRALSIAPGDRFASVEDFADALAGLRLAANQRTRNAAGANDALVKALRQNLEQVGMDGAWLQSGLPQAPTASINYGAAGVAGALLRVACARDDASLLSLADIWSMKAVGLCDREDGFLNAEMELTADVVGRSSIYHSPAGVFLVRALVASAMGDVMSEGEAIESFLSASTLPAAGLDLTVGRSSSLLGCAFLLDEAGKNPLLDCSRLREFGNKTFEELEKEFAAFGPIADGEVIHLGIAHGWAGYLYVLLQWHRAAGKALGPQVERRLAELAEIAEPSGRGLRWPWQLQAHNGQIPYMPGWCNGSAGIVFLWTLAYRVLGQPHYLDLADGAAWDAWEAPEAAASLCCGLVGRSYALLNLYKHSGQGEWLERARTLAVRAVEQGGWQENLPHSLYKGELALAPLVADLERPEQAAQPFFEESVAAMKV